MADEKDASQKTEQPTQKRIEDAIKKGDVAFSREATSFLMLGLFTAFLVFMLPSTISTVFSDLSRYLSSFPQLDSGQDGISLKVISEGAIWELFKFIAVPLVLAFIASILSGILQNGFIYTPEVPMPDLKRISPIAGLGRLFSKRSLVMFLKGILKLAVVGAAVFLSVEDDFNDLAALHLMDPAGVLITLGAIITKLLLVMCAVVGVIAFLDIIYEKYSHIERLKMTKEELKEEMKQSEGDPEIKAKIRSIRHERARRRIAVVVPTADVIIVNPTHFAVALQYAPEEMHAPKVIAKGRDLIALRMKEIARNHDVPIMEDPPLARGLYNDVEIDQFIPFEYYKSVAQIMTKLKKYAKRRKK